MSETKNIKYDNLSLVKDITKEELNIWLNDDEQITEIFEDKKQQCMVAIVKWNLPEGESMTDYPLIKEKRQVRYNNFASEFTDNASKWQIEQIARKGHEACSVYKKIYEKENLNRSILHYVISRGLGKYDERQELNENTEQM
ncbi:MAG: hypothetical protein IJZ26_00655 [Clostridia bacterium]|nr:hypothetical protein [Clostridia bacterium]MBQ9786147.1 hypothetical protein [Clostridia bacterium]